MTADPFRASGCTCSETAKIRAVLEARPEPLCEVHESGAIAARDAAAARRQAEYDQAVIREAIRDLWPQPEAPPFTAGNDGAAVKRLLADALQAPVTEADHTPLDAA